MPWRLRWAPSEIRDVVISCQAGGALLAFLFVLRCRRSRCFTAKLAGLSLTRICLLIRDEIVLTFGTASGEVVLPRLIAKLEQAGADQAVVGFVLPAGYSFNLGGTSIYMAIAVAFIAQATDTPFSWQQQLAVLVDAAANFQRWHDGCGRSFHQTCRDAADC